MVDDEPSADLKLDIELQKALLPWWRKPVPVAVVTAILAAIVPITTAVSEHYQKARELALQESKQKQDALMEQLKLNHSVQMDYLQHMGNDIERARTLRMIIALNDDKRLISWATSEKALVDIGAEQLKQQIETQVAIATRERSARAVAERKAGKLLSDTQLKEAQISQLKNAAREAKCAPQFRDCLAPSTEVAPEVRPLAMLFAVKCISDHAECVETGVWPTNSK